MLNGLDFIKNQPKSFKKTDAGLFKDHSNSVLTGWVQK